MDEKKPWYLTYAPALSVGIALMIFLATSIWGGGAKMEARPTRPEVKATIQEIAASKSDVAEMRECLKGLKEQMADFRKDVGARFDRLEKRVDKVKNGD